MTKPLLYWVNAFTDEYFAGNAAAIVLHTQDIAEETMQALAKEFNISETAFVKKEGEHYRLRWFTPEVEVPLCGHATLAAAVAMHATGWIDEKVSFTTLSGILGAKVSQDASVTLDFPLIETIQTHPDYDAIKTMFGHTVVNQVIGKNGMLLVELASSEQVAAFEPDFTAIRKLHTKMLMITAPGVHVDFVSRFFAPEMGIDEDPVTGSAHCVLGPYWAEKLGKYDLTAEQISARVGKLKVTVLADVKRVELTGHGKIIVEGNLALS